MAKNIYHDGKLIPAKDWDFDLKKPKAKQAKKQEVIEVAPEVVVEPIVEILED